MEPMTILLLATAGVLGALSLVLARRSSAAAVELAVSKAATDVARQEAETRVEQARRQVELEGAESLARSREQLEAEFEESRQRSRAEEARLATIYLAAGATSRQE